MEIIKLGKKIKYTKRYKHKCSCCKTKFIYDLDEDTKVNSIVDWNRVVQCPNCEKYDLIEDNWWGIKDKKVKDKENK